MTRSRRRLLLLCVLFVAIGAIIMSGTAAAHSPATETLASTHVDECAATPPADHAPPDGNNEDVIGWVDGFWYNQSVEIEDPDELTEEELEDLTARTAARVEALRCLTFAELPPLEMVTRDEYRQDIESFFEEEMREEDAQFANAQLAVMLTVGTEEDAFEVMIENRAGFAAAFYDVEEEFMGFVTDDPEAVDVDQVILAHELLHALQDEHFELEPIFEEDTSDQFMSSLAVVEGEAVLVDGMYEDNCGEWVDECIRLDQDPGAPPNWALTIEQLAAYHSPLVAHIHTEAGWDGVNALHDQLPDSMVEVLKQEQYGEFERTSITVPDQSSAEWERLTSHDQEYDIVGQHGLTSILIAPSYESQGRDEVIDTGAFLQEHIGGVVDFNHPATDGWESDKLYTYGTADGDLGSVWKLAWSDAEEADRFADAYTDLIEFRGGEQSAEYGNVYTFEENDDYDMAVGIERTGDRVWIVMAPSVEQLEDVHADFRKDTPGHIVVTEVTPDATELEAGERLELSVTVENIGDATTHERIEAQLEGDAFDLESLELDGGETTTVQFEFDSADTPPGTYQIDIVTENDEASASITILADPEDDDVDDDLIPGFGVIAGLTGLAVLSYLLQRRRR